MFERSQTGEIAKQRGAAGLLAGLLAGAVLLGGCDDHEPAMARGDRLWAEADIDGALAEYRLAASQSGDDVEVLRRVAHGFARTGQAVRAREAYDQLLAQAPEYTDQAVFDYIDLARQRLERRDRYGMAEAVEAALVLRPELSVPDLAEPLARFYAENGEPERALVYFQRALYYASPEEAPPLLFAIGQAQVGQGNCREAMGYFEAYVRRAPRGSLVNSARFHWGQCAFERGRELVRTEEGNRREALELFTMVNDLGVPEHLQDESWFERGEILFTLGRYAEALEAYRKVLELNPARTGHLVDRALRGIERIRFRDADTIRWRDGGGDG